MASMNKKPKPVNILISFKEISLRSVGKLLFMLLEGRKKKTKIERDLHGSKFAEWSVHMCTCRTTGWTFTYTTCDVLFCESMS